MKETNAKTARASTKQILSLLLSLVLLCTALSRVSLPARAEDEPVYSGSCGDNLTWSFNPDTGLLSIEGSGPMNNYYYAPWFSYRLQITALSLPEGLTSIGKGAFRGCSGLTSISFPEGLTSIGSEAFSSCIGLTSLSLPEGLTSIGEQAFSNCRGLTSISFPDGLIKISYWAFSFCTGLTSLSLPAGLTRIDNGAFRYCSGLTSISFQEGLTSIGAEAFIGCISLTSLSLPAGLTSIGQNAFESCTKLESVEIPDSVTRIYHGAFLSCDRLHTLVVRSGDTYIQGQNEYMDSEEDLREEEKYTLGVPEKTIIYTTETTTAASYSEGEIIYRSLPDYAEEFGYELFRLDSFNDVAAGQWFEIPVAWAVGKGITAGTGGGAFSPSMDCTREQVVTFLWAAYGKESPSGQSSPFRDVKPGDWFYTPVLWASERGISSGIGNGSFGVGTNCSRAQVVTFLWAAAGKPRPESQTNPFTDVPADAYYRDAVLWAVEKGITGGTGEGRFSPDMICTRAQVVTFLYAALEKNK